MPLCHFFLRGYQSPQKPTSAFLSFLPFGSSVIHCLNRKHIRVKEDLRKHKQTNKQTTQNLGLRMSSHSDCVNFLLASSQDLVGDITANCGFTHLRSHQARWSLFFLFLLLSKCGLCWFVACFCFCFVFASLTLYNEIATEIKIKPLKTCVTTWHCYDSKHIFLAFYQCIGLQCTENFKKSGPSPQVVLEALLGAPSLNQRKVSKGPIRCRRQLRKNKPPRC